MTDELSVDAMLKKDYLAEGDKVIGTSAQIVSLTRAQAIMHFGFSEEQLWPVPPGGEVIVNGQTYRIID